jgi:hypothetical protein
MDTRRITDGVRGFLRKRGYVIERAFAPDYEPSVLDTIEQVRPYTMTSIQRIAAVCAAAEHIAKHKIPGAVLESGVWKGGSSMAAAISLLKAGERDRDIYLFDTFEGIPKPDEIDTLTLTNESSVDLWEKENAKGDALWLEAKLEEVRGNMARTGYPMERIHFVKGLVEDTIPTQAPAQLALLRLDTDWYASTKVEMEELWPKLSAGGILIIDDYGHLEGSRRAVDEYLAGLSTPVFLNRIDYTGRLAVKPG